MAPPLFVSTRGGCPPASFCDAVLAGFAPDGGLYVPQHWPIPPDNWLKSLAGAPFHEVAFQVRVKG